MKKLILSLTLPSSLLSFGGSFVYPSMYNKVAFSQGMGVDKSLAEADAKSTIPTGYVADPANSPAVSCSGGQRLAFNSKNNSCADKSQVVYTLPLVKK